MLWSFTAIAEEFINSDSCCYKFWNSFEGNFVKLEEQSLECNIISINMSEKICIRNTVFSVYNYHTCFAL